MVWCDIYSLFYSFFYEPLNRTHYRSYRKSSSFSFKNKLKETQQGVNWLRWTLLTLLLASEISYHYWAITNDVWRFHNQMPFHLCGVASVVSIIGLLTMRPFWIQLAFFLGVLPAFLALVTPELPYDYQHFRFWKFFIHHTAITWACLFLALSRPQVITMRSFFLFIVYCLCTPPWSAFLSIHGQIPISSF
ncbi:hypothetical protein B481_0343 [Planococcus halocryophilus Or1]|nr:hypothetical protein B481_0343 [Planococcus halocryophilus Or1]